METQVNIQPQSPDHDILIQVVTKLDVLMETVKELKDGMTQQLKGLQARADKHDAYHAQYNLGTLVPKYDAVVQDYHDFKVRFRLILAIAGAIYTLVAAVLVAVFQHFVGGLFK